MADITSSMNVASNHDESESVPCQNEDCVSLRKQNEMLKQKVANLIEEVKELRRNSVSIQQQAEQEEEFISNTLLKRIQRLKQEKESLAISLEQEEEFLTNDLTRKLQKAQEEMVEMEKTFEAESEAICNKLSAKINSLEKRLRDMDWG